MRTRIFSAAVLALLLLGAQGSALAATPDVNAAVCSVSQGQTPLLIAPAQVDTPVIKAIYRNTAGERGTWETAYTTADGRHWSRAGGNDVVIELANPFSGYTLDVYKNNKVIHSEVVSTCDPFVTVPLPVDEGAYDRTFRFSVEGTSGPATAAAFGIDRTAPTIAAVSRPAPGTADVTFSEPPVGGSESHQNWYVRWTITMEDGVRQVHTQAESVTYLDASTRRLTYSGVDESGFVGVDYGLISGSRYTDAAGNGLADTVGFGPF